MPLSPLTQNGADPSWYAALEQMLIARMLQNESVDFALDCVRRAAGPATVVSRRDEPPDWTVAPTTLPRYVAYIHDGELWVNIQGTYTATQWVLNVLSGIVVLPVDATTTNGMGFWVTMAEGIVSEIQAALPSVCQYSINVSGHSLGGGVGWYVAALLKRACPSARVRVLTFGSPRVVTSSYSGLHPDFEFNIQTRDDIVVHLPPNLSLPIVRNWQQVGGINVIRQDGTLTSDDYNAGGISLTPFDASRFRQHFPVEYYEALKARYDDLTPNATTYDLAACSGYVPGLPCGMALSGCPTGAVGGSSVANYKVSLLFNWGTAGWSEQYYKASLKDFDDFSNEDVSALASTRCEGLASVQPPSCIGWRVSLAESSQQSDPTSAPPGIQNFTGPEGLPGDRKNGYAVIMWAANRTHKRILHIKGLPDAWVVGSMNTVRSQPVNAAFKRWLIRFSNHLIRNQWGTYGLTSLVGSNITASSIDANGHLLVTAPTLVAVENDLVVLKGMRGPGTKGLTGRTRVIEVLTGSRYRLAIMQCSQCTFNPSNRGRLRLATYAVFPWTVPGFWKFQTYELGRPFDLSVGRRKAKCCGFIPTPVVVP